MLEELKKQVFEANINLPKNGLVACTWGNVSGIDREKGLVVIKPSDIPYDELTIDKLVVVDMDGNVVEGKLVPSIDLPTHLVLYRAFDKIGGIVHTHSLWATSWAQAGMGIPTMGAAHAEYFYGEIPCTRQMSPREITGNFEEEIGKVIVETFSERNPMNVSAVLVHSHGPFTWGKSPEEAVSNAVILERVAQMAYNTYTLSPERKYLDRGFLEKNFTRRHPNFGQKHNE